MSSVARAAVAAAANVGVAAIASPSPRAVGEAALSVLRPLVDTSATTLDAIHATHATLGKIVAAVHPTLSLYTFGSAYVYGVRELNSDVDFVLLNASDVADGQAQDPSSQKAKAIQSHVLGQLAVSLRKSQPTWQIEEVKRTRVPVLRVKPLPGSSASLIRPATGGNASALSVAFDVTANRRNGVRNSALLRAYFDQDPSARWLSMAVKNWSKRCGMNGGLAGFLTSYGFNLLVCFYLLQRGRVSFVPHTSTDVACVKPVPTLLALEAPADPSEVGESILDFLRFYRTEFDVGQHVVTLNRPGVTTKQQLNWTREAEDMKLLNSSEKVAYRLCIEDPYENNLNVGRNVTAFKFDLFRKHLDRGFETGLGFHSP